MWKKYILSKGSAVFKFGDTRWQHSFMFVCTHIEVIWGDVHQLLITGVESLQQHSVSSFAVQTDPALRVAHWRWTAECNEDKTLYHVTIKIPRVLLLSFNMSFLHTIVLTGCPPERHLARMHKFVLCASRSCCSVAKAKLLLKLKVIYDSRRLRCSQAQYKRTNHSKTQ